MSAALNEILAALEQNPVIAAVKKAELLEGAVNSGCRVVFLLCGDILSIAGSVDTIKAAGKYAFVHVDLIDGLSTHEVSVKFIKETTRADGIISTKAQIVRAAGENGLLAVQRFFILDSMALSNVQRQSSADIAEIMPAVNPGVVAGICEGSSSPVIVGGLIKTKKDVIEMLAAGALAISTSSPDVWEM